MEAETWFTAEEAVAFGLADELVSDQVEADQAAARAMAAFAVEHFKNARWRLRT